MAETAGGSGPPDGRRRPGRTTERWPLAGLAVAALAARLLVAVFLLPGQVLDDGGGDGYGYHALAVATSQGDPIAPDLFAARPPGFPWLAGLLYAVFSPSPYLLVGISIAASVAAVVVAWALAGVLGWPDRRRWLFAGAVAFDPTLLRSGTSPLSDSLHGVAVLAALTALLALRRRPGRRSLVAVTGACLAAAVLVKPASLLLWLIVGGFLVAWRQRAAAAVAATLALVPVLAWTARNVADNGIPTYSTVAPYALVFHRAAGIEARARGVSFNEVILPEFEARLAADLGLSPPEPYDYYVASRDRPTYDAQMRLALEVIGNRPQWYVAAIPAGLLRLAFQFPYPGLEAVWAAYYVVLYGAAAWGLWRVWVQDRSVALLCLIVVVYYAMTLVLLETTGFGGTRQAIPYLPLLYLLALWPGGRGAAGYSAIRRATAGRIRAA